MNKQEFKKKLLENGMKMSHFAKEIGVTPATITNWNYKNFYPVSVKLFFEKKELEREIQKLQIFIIENININNQANKDNEN